MGLGSSQPIADQRVYAQDTAPTDERDGVLWVDTSLSPRETFVYSTTTDSWEPVAITDHAQLENSPTKTQSVPPKGVMCQTGSKAGIEPSSNWETHSVSSNGFHFSDELTWNIPDWNVNAVTVHFQDGSSKSASASNSGTISYEVNIVSHVSVEIQDNDAYTDSHTVTISERVIGFGPHTHSITP